MNKRRISYWFLSWGKSDTNVAINGNVNAITNIGTQNVISRALSRRDEWLNDGCDHLISAIRDSLKNERGPYNPDDFPLNVSWLPAPDDLMPRWSEIGDLVRSSAVRRSWPGSAEASSRAELADAMTNSRNLATLLSQVPTHRLAVLGEPGSGKTTLLTRLVQDLLDMREREASIPIPVMVSLATWPPAETGFHEWLEGQLTINFPGLSRTMPWSTRRAHRTMARELLAKNRILIVLDALDEIPADSGVTAIGKISDELGQGQGLVIASHASYFRDAMAVRRLPGMAAIELQPLAIENVVSYLQSTVPAATTSWARLLPPHEGDDPPAAAQVLTTPRMATLARALYGSERAGTPPSDPAELLNLPEPEDVTNHLLDTYLDAAYRRKRENRPAQAQRAKRTLAFLARDLDSRRGGTTDLAWWQLDGAAPPWLSGIVAGMLAGTAGAIGLGTVPRSAGIGLAAAAAVGLAVRLLAQFPRLGGRMSLSSDSKIGSSLGGGLLGGLAGTLAVMLFGVVTNPGSALTGAIAACLAVGAMRWFWAALAGGFAGGIAAALTGTPPNITDAWLVNGIGIGLAVGCAAGITRHNRPARGITFSWIGFAVGIAAGLTMGTAAWLQAGEVRGLIVGAVTVLGASYIAAVDAPPANTKKAATPESSMSHDRRAFWVNAVLGGLVVGVSTGLGPQNSPGSGKGLEAAIQIGIANTVAVGLAFGFVRATYGRFVLAKTWLAMRGYLPWRLKTFLRSAHETYGVLRQNGASYEFRVTELQHRLAQQPLPQRRFPERQT